MNNILTKLTKGLTDSKRFFKKHGSLILSLTAGASMIYAVISAVQATPKALEKIEEENAQSKSEIAQAAWAYYLPAIAAVSVSLACIFSAHIFNQKKQKALIGAYLLLEQSYKDYRQKAAELYGDDAEQNIQSAVVKAKLSPNDILESENEPKGEDLFYDAHGGRYFNATAEKVILAEYLFNRNFILRGWASVNEFYTFLGIPEIDGSDVIGWDISGYSWIDFDHVFAVIDGLECYIIYFTFPPYLLK